MRIINAPAFHHEKIADEHIDSKGIPSPQSFADSHVPLVVAHDSNAEGPLTHISDIHGRSYLVTDTRPEGQPWVDQYGNPYQTITTKGNNLTRHTLLRSATAPSGFLPYGLQEGDALRRIARASKIMRKAGIDTERPIGIYQPQQLAYEGELVDVSDYKRLVLESMVRQINSDQDTQDFTLEEVGLAAGVLEQMDFFVTLRATSTAARIGDLLAGRPGPLGNTVVSGLHYENLSRVFNDYNSYAKAKAGLMAELGLAPDLPTSVDQATDSDALEHYFGEVLPRLMGKNMGLLHSLGLVHHFPHMNNFTGLGGIVDLDSVKGEALRMRDGHAKDLRHNQTQEKTGVSIQTIWRFGQYQGHGLDWGKISKHARENFTQIYMDTYDGSMDPNDRMKMIFVDAAFRPGGTITSGSPLEIESMERFYPGAKATLDEVEAMAIANMKEGPQLPVADYARMLIDLIRDPHDIWGMDIFLNEREDENGALLLYLGLPPTDDEILAALPKFYEANKDTGELYSQDYHIMCMLPGIKRHILEDIEKGTEFNIIQAFVERLPGAAQIEFDEVKSSLTSIKEEILNRIEAKIKKPGFEEFWATVVETFKTEVLDSFDRSIVPDNPYIFASGLNLDQHVAFWEFYQRRNRNPVIKHVVSGLTSEQLSDLLVSADTSPVMVDTSEEVLQIEPDENEKVRLVITDGDIDNIIHYQDLGGEYEGITYRQYRKSNSSTSSGATEALYLLQDTDDKFKLVHKKLLK